MDVLRLLRGARLVKRGVDGLEVATDNVDLLEADHGDPTADRYIGLYFASSQFNFTSELRSFYERINGTGTIRRLEIIFVSWPRGDDDDGGLVGHLADMPWLTLANNDRSLAKNLTRAIRVDVEKSGAMVVVVDVKTGRIVSRNYRSRFGNDADGTGFPWRPSSLDSLLSSHGGRLVDSTGALHDLDLAVQYRLLYFSANWCPPCKAFTPQLAKTSQHLVMNRAAKFQVIFVSFDRSHESFEQYFGGMPSTWLAVPYADEARRIELAELFLVQGIPRLIVLDKNNKVVCRDGRHEVTEDPEGKNFPWAPQLVELLTTKFSSRLNESPLLVLFTDGNEEELEQAKTILWPIAEELASRDDTLRIGFFVAGEDDVSDSLRDFAQLEDVVPLLAILDTLIGEKYVLNDYDDDGEDVELSTDVVRRFVWRFLDGSLEATPLVHRKSLTQP